MNILIFSPVWSHPQDSGNRLRIYSLTKHLKMMGYTIHFVYYVDVGGDINKRNFLDMEKEWDTLTVINKEIIIKRRTGNYEINEWYESSIHEKVNELVELFDITIVWTNYITHSKFLEYLPNNIFKIIDTHDVFSDRYKLFSDKKGVKYNWYSFSKKDEAKALDRADLVIAITEEEKKYFSKITDTDISVIGHIEEKHYKNKEGNSLQKIGFIGGGNQVNQVSINNFLELYFKNSKNKDQLQIVIAGRICNSIKIKNKNLILMGYIDNIEQFYDEVDLTINPLTFGTGQKIKSVEALSYGTPIISTTVGFEGIESSSKYHQIETIDHMVEIIDEIVGKPEILSILAEISQNIFDSYEKELDERIANIFDVYKLTPKVPERLEQKERYSIINKYRQKSQKESDMLIIQEGERIIEKKDQQIKKKTNELKQLKTVLKELSALRFSRHPIKKIKTINKLIAVYKKFK